MPLSPTGAKYLLIQHFGDIFYCDPDYYPVGRGDEQERAVEMFPAIRADRELFETILRELGLAGVVDFSDEQKLQIYRESKRLAAIGLEVSGDSYRFQLRVQDSKGEGKAIEGTVTSTGQVRVSKEEPTIATCPICLAAGTMIDTPGGPAPIETVAVGMVVWTRNSLGERVKAPVLAVRAVPVPETHVMVRLALADGRVLLGSLGHPLGDGRFLADVQPGEEVDGAVVVSVERVPRGTAVAYDILPGGDTGLYWADGMPVLSTFQALVADEVHEVSEGG